jgi:hypothetical protein
MKTHREWRYGSMHSSSQYNMEEDGLLNNTLAALLFGKETLVCIVGPKLAWTVWRRENICSNKELNLSSPVALPVAHSLY